MRSLQALLALFACAALPLHAAGLDDLTYTTTDGKVTITYCDRAATGELVIPPTIEDNPVTSIGGSAFRGCTHLTSITIPDSVTSIAGNAFRGCVNLTSISIPDGVTSIASNAFLSCSSLTSITFLGAAPTVGRNVFRSVANGAVAIVLGEHHVSFGEVGTDWNGLTLNCNDGNLCWLTWTTTAEKVTITNCGQAATGELVIPATLGGIPVTSIGGRAFQDCSSLISITFEGNSLLDSIGDEAFYECSSLTSITIPDSVTSIGDGAFNGCISLTTIGVGVGNANYTVVDGVLFNTGMTLLHTYPAGKIGDEYNIPDGVTSIGGSAFQGCTHLTSITIPENVTDIGKLAFSGCSNLASVTFLGNAPSVGNQAFFGVADGAVANVSRWERATFDDVGADWNGLAIACNDGNLCWLTWTTTAEKVTITACNTAVTGELVIPATIGGIPVTSIGERAFYECSSLTSITIPDSVTSIGDGAFNGCSSLESITIPDGVTSIGLQAFNGCSSLTSIAIPDSVTSIGGAAFRDCSRLISITFGANSLLDSIGKTAFMGCSSLTSITIPEGVTSIEGAAFYKCISLTSITFLGAAPTVGHNVFRSVANGAVAIVLGEHHVSFGEFGEDGLWVIRGGDWYGLTLDCIDGTLCWLTWTTTGGEITIIDCDTAASGELVIPDTIGDFPVTRIRGGAFKYCRRLTKVTLPDGITRIEDSTFYGCTSLAEMTIPDSVTSIGDEAFYECSSLTSITIPDGVTSIGWRAFRGCSSVTSITFLGTAPAVGSPFRSAAEAFSGVAADTPAVVTPEALASFGEVGTDWNGLTLCVDILHCWLEWTTTEGGVTITACNTAVTGELVIPAILGDHPVTSIGGRAFQDCSSLISITFEGNSLLDSIGDEAFYECSSLTSITIPDSVTSIGDGAFNGCISLTTIGVGVGNANYTVVDGVLFNTGMTLLHTYPAGKIGDEYNIPDGVTSIGDGAFWSCSSLTTIKIPDGVTSIGDGAFNGCISLRSITFGANSLLDSIGNYAFTGCTRLRSITIPDGVPRIGERAFQNCTSLTSIIFGGNSLLDSIGRTAFEGCSSLTSITIPEGVTSIEGAAFQSCTSLTSFIFRGDIPSLGTDLFGEVDDNTVITALALGAKEKDTQIAQLEAQLATAIAERDALPTQAAYDAVVAERNARPTAEQLAAVETERDARPLDSDEDGLTDAMEAELETDVLEETVFYLQEDYTAAVAAAMAEGRTAGQGDVTSDPASYSLVTQASYDAVVAERDARPTAEQLAAVEAERDARPTQAAYDTAVTTARTEGRGDVTSDPASYSLVTQANYDDVIAERDARFTEDQIHAMSADYTMGLNEAGNVQIKISFIESADLHTFTQFTVNPDSVSVVDGKICMEFPSEDRGFFFRFRVE